MIAAMREEVAPVARRETPLERRARSGRAMPVGALVAAVLLLGGCAATVGTAPDGVTRSPSARAPESPAPTARGRIVCALGGASASVSPCATFASISGHLAGAGADSAWLAGGGVRARFGAGEAGSLLLRLRCGSVSVAITRTGPALEPGAVRLLPGADGGCTGPNAEHQRRLAAFAGRRMTLRRTVGRIVLSSGSDSITFASEGRGAR